MKPLHLIGRKKCSRCDEHKTFAEFYHRGDQKGSGLQSWCKKCVVYKNNRGYSGKPDQDRKQRLRNKYGMTVDQYDLIYCAQGGRCLICDKHQSELKQKLCVDHNHETGAVRGLLCVKCNAVVLNLVENHPELLSAAERYLAATQPDRKVG